METVFLGRTGIGVPRLCVGGWQAAGWQSSSDKTFTSMLEYALERGLYFIDTAPAYGKGRSEELIGKVIKGRRDKVVLATKFFFNESTPTRMRSALEGSLRRLGTDYIDLYQQHWPPKTPPLMETLTELERLKSEGKIRAIGVSNWMEPEWSEVDDPARVECLQPCYSLLWRVVEREVLPLCRRYNIAVIPYSPLCQGILAGRFKDLKDVPSAPSDPRRQNIRLRPENIDATRRVVLVLEEVAVRYGKTPAQCALRWLLQPVSYTHLTLPTIYSV